MKGVWVSYSAQELAWVEANKALPRAQLHAQFVDRFQRPDVSQQNLKSLCLRKGWHSGRDGRFLPGHAPTKGGEIGCKHPRSIATRFPKGKAPPNLRPLWSERPGKDGYIEMKVPVQNPYTGHATRFMHKHRYLWEQVNGPLPRGHALKCLDGNRTNCDPANWIAIPRSLLPRLAGRWTLDYDSAPDDLKPTILAIARLNHALAEAAKRKGAA